MGEVIPGDLRLIIVLVAIVVATAYIVWRVEGTGSMAASIRRLSSENAELKREVERLQTAFDSVLRENNDLRCKLEILDRQLSALNRWVTINRPDVAAVAREQP